MTVYVLYTFGEAGCGFAWANVEGVFSNREAAEKRKSELNLTGAFADIQAVEMED